MENEIKKQIRFFCVVCDQESHSIYTRKNNHNIWKCDNCGLLSIYPIPKPSETLFVYGKEYFSGGGNGFGYVDYDVDKEAMRSIFENYLKQIKCMNINEGKKLLDIGAATGYFIKIAKGKGFDVIGLELSDYAANIGRNRGLDIRTGTIRETDFKSESFDIVTMWDVLEHVENPRKDLMRIDSLMKDGGILAINTPDCGSLYARALRSRWHLLVPPEHINYFNKKSLKIILEKAGFEIISFSKIGKKFTVEYIMHTISRWLKISFLQRFAVMLGDSKLGKISLPINLRDNICVFARKI